MTTDYTTLGEAIIGAKKIALEGANAVQNKVEFNDIQIKQANEIVHLFQQIRTAVGDGTIKDYNEFKGVQILIEDQGQATLDVIITLQDNIIKSFGEKIIQDVNIIDGYTGEEIQKMYMDTFESNQPRILDNNNE